jgi:hypothetical protein
MRRKVTAAVIAGAAAADSGASAANEQTTQAYAYMHDWLT